MQEGRKSGVGHYGIVVGGLLVVGVERVLEMLQHTGQAGAWLSLGSRLQWRGGGSKLKVYSVRGWWVWA